MRGTVVSLCDRTGNMVRPWTENGYRAVTVDIRSYPGDMEGREHIIADILSLPESFALKCNPVAVFAFPPCTNLAVSGARWFRSKGLAGLIHGLQLVEKCRAICETSGAPWMLENPVSTLSTYWREPDHVFHPADFTEFELGDNYTKKTCLWIGGGFVMPKTRKADLGPPDDRIHKATPSEDRSDIRSATPMGFARAVFEANAPSP